MLDLPFGDQLHHEKADTIARNKVFKIWKTAIRVRREMAISTRFDITIYWVFRNLRLKWASVD